MINAIIEDLHNTAVLNSHKAFKAKTRSEEIDFLWLSEKNIKQKEWLEKYQKNYNILLNISKQYLAYIKSSNLEYEEDFEFRDSVAELIKNAEELS